MPPEDRSRYCLMDFMWLSILCVDVSFCSIPADDVSTFETIRSHTYSPRPPFQEASLKPSESQESPQNAAEAAILESTQEGPHVLVVSLKPFQG